MDTKTLDAVKDAIRVSNLEKLASAPEPVKYEVGTGCALGYRRRDNGDGTFGQWMKIRK